jgi:hypothetical protein
MMILRFTTKAFKKFDQKPKLIEVDNSENDFGEWYVNTADSFNRGNLFMPVMHTDSLYTMLIPIEKNMAIDNFVNSVFASLMIRILRLEIPRESTERIIKSYNEQAVFSKTKSRSLVGNLSNIIQDIETMVEYRRDVAKGNNLDLARMEYRINDSPRTLHGKTVWPLKVFYSCIRNFCPELPYRIPLPLDMIVMHDSEIATEIFKNRVSEKLLLKIDGSALGAEVLFNYEEVQLILKVVNDTEKVFSKTYGSLYADLKRMLSFKLQGFEAEI